jgi:flagellar motor switch protein FliG
MSKNGGIKIDGLGAAADLLKGLDPDHRKRLMTELEARQPGLTQKLSSRMLVFEDLARIEGLGLQLVLKEVPHSKLVLALRRAPDLLHEAIYRGMTARGGEALREEVAGQGPKRVTDIQAAQADILKIAARLADEGKITFIAP